MRSLFVNHGLGIENQLKTIVIRQWVALFRQKSLTLTFPERIERNLFNNQL